jgi:hypothetical protein
MMQTTPTTQRNAMDDWRDVPSTGNLLQVTPDGRVRRKSRPLVYSDGRKGILPAGTLRLTPQSTGYFSVSFSGKHLLVHRLVAEVFLPPPDAVFAKNTVNHKDGNKRNNVVSNLEWASYKENTAHARATGLNKQHGERTNLSKYTDQFIAAVRNVHAKYNPTYEELGAIFGLTGCHARQIVLRLTRSKDTAE